MFSEDFGNIAQHFRLVRTFYSVYYGTEVMPFAAAAGLKVALGVSIGRGLWMGGWVDGGDGEDSGLDA